jgi:subtilisin family serine protease
VKSVRNKVVCAPAGAALLLLSGCGGGGGGAVNSTGTPPASTTTTTPPTDTTTTGTITPPTGPTTVTVTPTVVDYNDAEYTRSNAATSASAISAWNAGSTGAGVTIAILDSGLTDAKGQFAGRISAASKSISDTAGYADQDGHGTAVAAVAAAARNGSDVEGVAFGATVMALRTDQTGSCATDDGCSFSTATLATAIDYAVTNGAKVINLSLGGNSATSQMRAAINRATAAGVIIVIAGGNDGDAEPDPLAQIASESIARGLVIIAGATDATGALASFSDKAGTFGNYYLAALGSRVRAFDNNGADFFYSGTSFSAPAVSAAIALLEAAFPNLTAAQVVSLLYASATDAGATGVDSTFGRGILNLVKAFQPLGTSSLPGSTAAISLSSNAVLSGAMGDATLTGSGLDKTVILDGYGRAFRVNLAGTVAHIGQRHPLANAMTGNLITRAQQAGPLAVSLTVARDLAGEPWTGFAQRGLTANGPSQAQTVSAVATMAFGHDMQAGFGFSTSGRRIGDMIGGDSSTGGSFMIARGPAEGPGFDSGSGMAGAFRQRFGRLAIDASAERGTLRALLKDRTASGYTMMNVRATRAFGPLALGIGVGLLDEDRTVLGARFGALLGGRGAVTRTAEMDARLVLGRGWSLHGAWRQGWTSAAAGGALTHGRLESTSSAFDIGRIGARTRFGLRFAQPLRVTGGGFALSVPSGYDYATGLASYTLTSLDLAPAGHERDFEASYGFRLAGGWIDTNLYVRQQPGNIAAAADDMGAALRYGLTF